MPKESNMAFGIGRVWASGGVDLGALHVPVHCSLLRFESHDFSQAEKERTAYKAEQIHKMKHIFTRNNKLFIIIEMHFNFYLTKK